MLYPRSAIYYLSHTCASSRAPSLPCACVLKLLCDINMGVSEECGAPAGSARIPVGACAASSLSLTPISCHRMCWIRVEATSLTHQALPRVCCAICHRDGVPHERLTHMQQAQTDVHAIKHQSTASDI